MSQETRTIPLDATPATPLDRFLADSIPQQVWTARPEGSLDHVNRQVLEYFQRPESAFLERGWHEVVHPDDLTGTIARWALSLATGEPYEAEYRLRRADGEYRWHIARAVAKRDASGRIERWYGSNTDVEEQKRAVAALTESRERMRAALDASATGTFRWDVATSALDWDDNLDRLFGLPPGKTARRLDEFQALVHPDDRAAVQEALGRCIQEGADFDLEFRVVWPDGSIHWLLDRGQMVRDAEGRPRYMTGACVDITARKQIEEDLRRNTHLIAWQRSVLESIAKGAPVPDTLDLLCREIEALSPGRHFSVLLAENGHLRHGAAPSLPEHYNKAVDGIAIGEGVNSCGTAAHRRAQVIVQDIAEDPLWKDFKALALPIGLRACWSTPIFGSEGNLLGTWAIYSETPGAPRRQDEEVVAIGTRLAAVAIERARDEEALRLTDERFRLVARATNDAVWDWDLKTDMLWWNENFASMFGYPLSELEPTVASWTSRIHPEDLVRVKSGILSAIERGAAMWQDEYRFRHKSGEYAHILDRGFIIRDAQGKGVRMVGSMMDVSARRSAEAELHRVRHNLELIMNSAGEGIYGVDATGITTFVNEAALEMLGLTREQAIGIRLHPIIHHTHPDGSPHPAPECPIYQAAHGAPGAVVKDDVFWRKDGTAVPVEYVVEPLVENGRTVGAVTVFKDVTELRRSERELQRVKNDLELILNSAGEGVYGVDATGITTFINATGLRMLGLTREEAIGVRLHPVIHHTHPDGSAHPAPECPIYQAAHGAPGAVVKDDVFWRKDGTAVPVEYVVEPLVENGRTIGAVTVFKDVTARRRAEKALRESQDALARAQEIAHLGSWTIDLRSGAIEYSDEMRRIHGVAADEPVSPEVAAQIVHPEDLSRVAAQIEEVRAGRSQDAIEYRAVHSDGTIRHVEARVEVARDPAGNAVRLIGTSLDITERKRSEQAIRDARDRLDLAVGAARMGTWDLDLVSDTAVRSLRHDEIFGYSDGVEQWSAERFFSHVEPEHRAAVQAAFDEAMTTGRLSFECRIRRGDGRPAWIAASGQVVREAGRAARILGVVADITERMEAKEALEAERNMLSTILQQLPSGVVIADASGKLILANERFNEILMHEFVPAEGIAQYARYPVMTLEGAPLPADRYPMARSVAKGEVVTGEELLYRRGDGEIIHILVNSAPVRDRNGSIVAGVGALIDITSLKKAQEEVRYQSEIVRTITDNAGSALFMMDERGHPIFLNDAAKRMTGYASIDEIKGRPLHDAVHFRKPDGSPYPMEECPIDRANAEIRALKDQRETFVRKDGTLFPVEYNVAPIVRGGRTQGVVIEVRDITARLHAEEELHRRNIMLAWQRRVLETAARGAPLHETLDVLCREAREQAPDHHFTVLLADEKAGVLRHGAAPTLPEHYNQAVDGIPIGEGVGSCGTAASRREPVIVTDIATDPLWKEFKGLALPVGLKACWSTPIFGLDGRLLGTWAVYRESAGAPEPQDAELVAIATRLAAVVIERAQAEEQLKLRAEELAQLTEALQRSNKELDQFAYITSHDLKAPLRGIANLSRWIEEDSKEKLSEDSRGHLELMRGRVHRMESLIDAILHYSRVGRVKARPVPVDTGAVVKEVVDLISPPPGFRVEVDGELPTVYGERLRLSQVFMNLIANAVKHHHDAANGLVKISAVDEGAKWRFTVRDNGPGIAPRFHEKVFVIFQTLEARDRVEGTGIGLALVKKIVESNGGTVTLDSDVGAGAAFTFTWPKTSQEAS